MNKLTQSEKELCDYSPIEIINYYTVYPQELLKYNTNNLILYILKISIFAVNYYIKKNKIMIMMLINIFCALNTNFDNYFINLIKFIFSAYVYFVLINIFTLIYSCTKYYFISSYNKYLLK